MTGLVDLLNKLAESDVVFYVTIIILVIISLVMFYLIFSENKKKFNEEEEVRDIPLIQSNRDEISETLNLLNKEENDANELELISKQLSEIPKERAIKLTPYEEEQESKAIISYDELLSKTNEVSIEYSDTVVEDDVSVKKVDLEKTGKIELDPIKRELNSRVNILGYEHEEDFLSALKQLRSMLD